METWTADEDRSAAAAGLRLPHDSEAERQVLGALMIRPDLILSVAGVINKDDFYQASHRLIFEAIHDVGNSSAGDLDAVQIIQYLTDRSLIDQAGGGPYVMQLVQDVMAPGSVTLHARRLRNFSLRRELMTAASSIVEDASRPSEDENVFLRSVEDRILRITNSSFSEGIVPVSELKKDFGVYLKNMIEAKGGLTGSATHFTGFDQLTSGLKGGELIILAARPGMGKTTFALNIASNMAQYNKHHVLIYSLEMSKMELVMRLLCSEAQFANGDLKRGNVHGDGAKRILEAIERVCAWPVDIDDSGDLDVWELVTRARKLKVELDQRGEGLGLIIVDYLQLVTDPEARKHGRQHEVATISRTLKQLAKKLDVPVIALSQMNRSVEQRRGDSARPQLSDLRESGAIEQDADIVMFIHHPEPGEAESMEDLENKGTVEVILAKHRNGPVDSFRLAFRPEINRFDNRVAEPEGY
jgi:replicative DNA helicase